MRSGSAWSEQQKLTASDGAASDHFGVSVAISRNVVVVGAEGDDIGSNSSQGSAYMFSIWSEQQKLTASDGAARDLFGISVAISGETVVVGTSNDDNGLNLNQGSVYVFTRSGTSWSEQQKLTASDGAAGDGFGKSVAISTNVIVVGAPGADIGSNLDRGSVYLFAR